MAIRRHIVAVRNTTKDALREALAALQVSEIEEVNGWCFALASVWTTGARDLLEAIAAFEGPAFLVTTEDGSRWWLHLLGAGRERFSTYHEFTTIGSQGDTEAQQDDWQDIFGAGDLDEDCVVEIGMPDLPERRLTPLDFEDDFFEYFSDDDEDDDDEYDEDDQSPAAWISSYYEECGIPLPAALVAAIEAAEPSDRTRVFLTRHAEYIADALAEFGVPHDRDEVIRILTGDGVTRHELESDLGNLLRFLVHLGLGAMFEEPLRELERASEEPPYDPSAEIRKVISNLPLHAIEDGPAMIPVEKGALLARIASSLEEFAEISFEVGLDTASTPWPRERVPSYTRVFPAPHGVALTFDGPNVLFAHRARQRVGRLLAEVPDGVSLELSASCEAQSFRFCGTVVGGSWQIEEASVALSAGEIHEMMDLFEKAETGMPQVARDEAEADAIMAAAATDIMLYNAPPQGDGLLLCAGAGNGASALAGLFFRRRYRHRWDVTAIEARLEENFRNWAKLESDMAEQSALPTNGTVVYAGTASRFLEPHYNASSVDDTLRKLATDTDALDGAYAALGFSHLGVLVCERIGGGFLR